MLLISYSCKACFLFAGSFCSTEESFSEDSRSSLGCFNSLGSLVLPLLGLRVSTCVSTSETVSTVFSTGCFETISFSMQRFVLLPLPVFLATEVEVLISPISSWMLFFSRPCNSFEFKSFSHCFVEGGCTVFLGLPLVSLWVEWSSLVDNFC